MKSIIHALLAFAVVAGCASPSGGDPPDASTESAGIDRLTTTPGSSRHRYQLTAEPPYDTMVGVGVIVARNPAHGFTGTFESGSLRVRGAGESWDARVTVAGYGCDEDLAPLAAGDARARGNRVEQRHGAVIAWYLNGPLGLQQNFTLPEPPACMPKTGTVTVGLELSGLAPRVRDGGSWISLVGADGVEVLRYTDLYVEDAGGRALAARMRARGSMILIDVDAATATFPLEIDPTFSFEQKLLPTRTGLQLFGHSVAIDGDTLVSGAMVDNELATDAGAGYVFVRSGGAWSLQQRLVASDGATKHRFGKSTDLSGDTAVFGAPGAGGAETPINIPGAAYVFVRSGTAWSEQQKVVATDGAANDRFGQTVRVDRDTLIASAPRADIGANPDQGAAYVFVRSGATWVEQQKLVAPDGAPGDQFGYFVDVQGDVAVVGARFDDIGANVDQGSVYTFTRSGNTWTFQQKLTASDGAPGDRFGRAVSLSGTTLISGAFVDEGGRGAAYVFVFDGVTWSEQQKLTATDGVAGDEYAKSVAVAGDVAVISSFKDDVTNLDQGSVYVYSRTGTTWTEDQKLVAFDPADSDRYGQQVALSATTLVVGNHLDDNAQGVEAGSVYVYTLPAPSTPVNGSFEADYLGWTLLETPSNPTAGTFAIVDDGQTVSPGDTLFDFADNVPVVQGSQGLPITYDATDGTKLAAHLQGGAQNHRMFQTITVPACQAAVHWDMAFTSHNVFDPAGQFFAINVRDPSTDAILATPFKTLAPLPAVVPAMTPFEADLSTFSDQTIRLDFEHQVQLFFFDIAWDRIRVVCKGLSANPTLLAYADTAITTQSSPQTATITNQGSGPLTITATQISSGFVITDGPTLPITLPVTGSTTFDIAFAPAAIGPAVGTLRLVTDDPDPSVVVLSGTGLGLPVLAAPATFEFGDQRVGQAGQRDVTVSNTGTGALTITSLTTAAPFAVVGPPLPITVPAGGSTTIQVTFTPASLGPASGTLEITSDDPANPTTNVGLTGTGVEPTIAVDPTSLAFGDQRIDTTASRTITVTNDGTGILTINSLSFPPGFASPNALPISVAPNGGTATITVTFTPTAVLGFAGNLTIGSDAANSTALEVPLSGTGIAPVISINPSPVSFGSQRVDTTGTRTVTISNTGSDLLTITSITTIAPFSTAAVSTTIAVGNSIDIEVDFTPTTTGPASANLVIQSDAANGATTNVTMTGTGIAPAIAVSTASIAFPNQRVGTTSAGETVTVTNTGDDTLTISALTAGAPFANTDSTPITIAPGNQATLTVTFTPDAAAPFTDQLVISSDALGAPSVVVELSGTGVEPLVQLSNTPIAFGNRSVGTTASRFFTIDNAGTSDLQVTAVTIAAPYAVVAVTTPFTLPPGGQAVIEVRFAPVTAGLATETLTIASDASSSPTTFDVTGTGTVPGLTPSTTTLAFGTVKVGTSSAPQTFTLTNTGGAPAVISTANAPDGYTISGPALPTSVLPDGQVTFTVTFNPAMDGIASGAITFTSDAPVVPVIDVDGTGGIPLLVSEPDSLEFGAVAVGTTSDVRIITLLNESPTPLVITGIAAAAPFTRTSMVLPLTIPPNTSISLGVLFSPTASGDVSGVLMIDSDGNSLSVPLSGEGLGLEPPPGAGCCSTSSDSGSSFLFALLIVPLLRRRRRS